MKRRIKENYHWKVAVKLIRELRFLTFFLVVSTSLSFSPPRIRDKRRRKYTQAGYMPAVNRGDFFYAQEAFQLSGFAAFVPQRGLVLSLAAYSLVAKLKAPGAPRDYYLIACHLNLDSSSRFVCSFRRAFLSSTFTSPQWRLGRGHGYQG